MHWLLLILTSWLGYRVLKLLVALCATRSPAALPVKYRLDARKNWALAIAHPAASASMDGGFANELNPSLTPALAQSLSPALKHFFSLKPGVTDAQIRAQLDRELPVRWYQLDLNALVESDDPRDALAFACARVTYALRVASMLGWLDDHIQWQLLALNSQRTAECFGNWEEFGCACARGRRQWISQSRADSLGAAFSEVDVQRWLSDATHPWRYLHWNAT
jgi:Protein of unknown function (DUF1266)